MADMPAATRLGEQSWFHFRPPVDEALSLHAERWYGAYAAFCLCQLALKLL